MSAAGRPDAVKAGAVARGVKLRPYRAGDEDAAIALWLRAWQAADPAIDFAARLNWWRTRWRSELVPACAIVVAEAHQRLIGLVTVDPTTHYLDQIVVDPDHWSVGVGTALLGEARRLSPAGLELDVNTDNIRALRFYRGQGFSIIGDGTNPISGRPVHRMRWQPVASG